MFCPKCGSILRPVEIKGKKVTGCSCGYSDKGSDLVMKEHVKKKNHALHIEDTDKEAPATQLTDEECPKCKHGQAEWWTVQTRAADEAPTRFLKCAKCKHTWREYN